MKSTDRRYRRNESDVIRRAIYELPTVTRSLFDAARIMCTERAPFMSGLRGQPRVTNPRDRRRVTNKQVQPRMDNAEGQGRAEEPQGIFKVLR